MQEEVTEEVLRKDEPEITVYSVEYDTLYQERTSTSGRRRRRWARPGA